MSADNWRLCPNCQTSDATFGIVVPPSDTEEKFREDYEIGMTIKGEFFVRYRGRCLLCGFGHSFTLNEQVLVRTGTTGGTET